MSEPLPTSFYDWIDAVQERYGQELSFEDTKRISYIQQLVSAITQILLKSQADSELQSKGDLQEIVEDVHMYLHSLLRIKHYILLWSDQHRLVHRNDTPAWMKCVFSYCRYHSASSEVGRPDSQTQIDDDPRLPSVPIELVKKSLIVNVSPFNLETIISKTWHEIRFTTDSYPPFPLALDFSRPYLGGAAASLYKKLEDIGKYQPELYAPILPFLQTPGTGKSRTVAELSAFCPGISICLRRNQLMSACLPVQDTSIYQILRTEMATRGSSMYGMHIAMAALILAVCDLFIDRSKPLRSCDWATVVDKMSHEFTDGIVPGFGARKRSESALAETPRAHQKSEDHLRAKAVQDIAAGMTQHINDLDREYQPQKKFGRDGFEVVHNIEWSLAEKVKHKLDLLAEQAHKHFFFLAIDEFAEFKQYLPAFRRLLSAPHHGMPLRTILIDTNIQIADVTIPETIRSATFISGDKRVSRPHVLISHDVMLWSKFHGERYSKFCYGQAQETYGSVFEFLPLMGRPLWADTAYEKDGKLHLPSILAKMIDGDAPTDLRPDTVFALAASRLPLQVVGVQGFANTAAFLQSQITLYLRQITAIESAATIVSSGCPSEPVMSLAAAHHHRYEYGTKGGPEGYWQEAIRNIRSKQLSGILNIGENGEETILILMTASLDIVAARNAPLLSALLRPATSMVNLLSWLTELHGYLDIPENYRQTFSKSWVNFTHFAQLDEQHTTSNPMPYHTIVQAWTRQCALLGTANQSSETGGVPFIYTGNSKRPGPDEPIEYGHMGMLSFLIKISCDQVEREETSASNLGSTIKLFKLPVLEEAKQPPSPLQFGIFYDLTGPPEKEVSLGQDYLTIRVGGYDQDTFPLMKRWDATTREDLIGFIGPVNAYADRKRYSSNTEEWRDTFFRTGARQYTLPARLEKDMPTSGDVHTS